MGNQLSQSCTLQSLQSLKLNTKEKQNLQLYIWRAHSSTTKYIPKVKFNHQQTLILEKQTHSCLSQTQPNAPNLFFEDFLCDFRHLKSYLDVSQLLCVFKMVLEGHRTIFSKFGASIVHEKCSFLAVNGQIRVWINPNYYLNQFWTLQIERREVRAKTQLIHNLNYNQPRFLNRQEFESKFVSILHSQTEIVRKIVKLMLHMLKTSQQSQKFKSFLENWINFLIINNEINFNKIQELVNQYAVKNGILVRNNIEEAVKRLVSEGKVFHSQKCSLRSLKGARKSFYTMDTKHNSTFIKIPQSARQSHKNSIVDLRKRHMSGFSNFHTFSKPNIHQSIYENQNNQTEKTEPYFYQKQSIIFQSNAKKYQHKRKLSKSVFIESTRNSNVKIVQDTPHETNFKKKENPFQEIIQKTNKNQNHNKKLGLSFQFSINLYTNQIQNPNKKTQNLTNEQSKHQNQINRHHNRQNSRQDSSNMNQSINSKPSSILKKSNLKLFEVQRSFNGFLNSGAQQRKNNKKLAFQEPIKYEHLQDVKADQHLCISTFQGDEYNQNTILNTKTPKNKYTDFIIDDFDETKKTTIRNKKCLLDNKLSVNEQKPFEEITKQQILVQNFDGKNILAKTVKNPQMRCQNDNNRGQSSMLVNIKRVAESKDQDKIRSKRRISVGGQGQKQVKAGKQKFNSKNYLGLQSIENNDHHDHHTIRTITRLLSSQNILQTSVGSFSSFQESQHSKASRYTGILTKMGRSVPFKKVADEKIKEIIQNGKSEIDENIQNLSKRKKTIIQIGSKLGSNRSLKV